MTRSGRLGGAGDGARPWCGDDAPATQQLLIRCCGNDPRARSPFLVHGLPLEGDEFRRTLVVGAEQPLTAVGTVWKHPWHPERFRLALHVDPVARRRGVGTLLFRELLRLAVPHATEPDPPLMTSMHGDDLDGRRFYARRGFRPLMRTRLGVVDPECVPSTLREDFARATANAHRAGYRIRTMRELARDDAGIGLALARLHAELYRDGHAWDPPAAIGDDAAVAAFMDEDEVIPDGLFAATVGATPAAVGSVRRTSMPNEVDLAWFGVSRNHRQHAHALTLALLARCLAFASGRKARIRVEVDEADGLLWAALSALAVASEPDWLSFARGIAMP